MRTKKTETSPFDNLYQHVPYHTLTDDAFVPPLPESPNLQSQKLDPNSLKGNGLTIELLQERKQTGYDLYKSDLDKACHSRNLEQRAGLAAVKINKSLSKQSNK